MLKIGVPEKGVDIARKCCKYRPILLGRGLGGGVPTVYYIYIYVFSDDTFFGLVDVGCKEGKLPMLKPPETKTKRLPNCLGGNITVRTAQRERNNLCSVAFCSPAKSLTLNGLLENPLVGKKLKS